MLVWSCCTWSVRGSVQLMSKRSSPSSFSREFPKSFCEHSKQTQRWSSGTVWIRHFSGVRAKSDAERVAEYSSVSTWVYKLYFLFKLLLLILSAQVVFTSYKWIQHLYLLKVNHDKKTLWSGQSQSNVFLMQKYIYFCYLNIFNLFTLTQAFQLK